jgi:RimJ/RimL family protein N-acetyltransferase
MYKHKQGLHFRKVVTGDLFALLKLKEESWWGTHNTSIINIEDQKRWYDNLGNDTMVLVGEKINEENPSSVAVGVGVGSEIDWLGKTMNISASIFKEHRKDIGLVKAFFGGGVDFAFEVLNMTRVGAEVLETHSAAQRIELGYLGFRVEGRRRKAVYKAGRYYDSIQLGLLKEEWIETKRVQELLGDSMCCNENFSHAKAELCLQRFKKLYKPLSLGSNGGLS